MYLSYSAGAMHGCRASDGGTFTTAAEKGVQTEHVLRSRINAAACSKGTTTSEVTFVGDSVDVAIWVDGPELEDRIPFGFQTGPLYTEDPVVYEISAAPVTAIALSTKDVIDGAAKVLFSTQPLIGLILNSFILFDSSGISPEVILSQAESSLCGPLTEGSIQRTIMFHLVLSGLAMFSGKALRYFTDDGEPTLLDALEVETQFLALLRCAQPYTEETFTKMECVFCHDRQRVKFLTKGRGLYDWRKAARIRDEDKGASSARPGFTGPVDSGMSTDTSLHANATCDETDIQQDDAATRLAFVADTKLKVYHFKRSSSKIINTNEHQRERHTSAPTVVAEMEGSRAANPSTVLSQEDLLSLLATLATTQLKTYRHRRRQGQERAQPSQTAEADEEDNYFSADEEELQGETRAS
eukprot:TRINITY_DN36872_c0_g1_i2.p1 TRINITY_DN36872_c0_g1~~TRINITY_DN36872_c0_g1_i2.p1  ORF type:complete len:466 (+),score=77.91 TRINITY_DN36872_c0_g1_i2:164-1399(+)